MNELQVRPERDTVPAAPAVKVRRKSLFREYSEAIIIAVLLALFIRQFAVQAFEKAVQADPPLPIKKSVLPSR